MNTVTRRMLKFCWVWLLVFVSQAAHANQVISGFWIEIDGDEKKGIAHALSKAQLMSTDSRLLKLDLSQLGEELAAGSTAHILLPDPYGGEVEFVIRPSSVMPRQLAERYPNIRAFQGTALNDSATTIRLELTEKGFSAQVMGVGGRWLIDPLPELGQEYARSYRYAKSHHIKGEPFCQLESPAVLGRSVETSDVLKSSNQRAKSTGESMRKYRIAVATTGEYGQFHGGTTAGALSAVVATMNRVDGIFQAELAIGLELIEQNDQVVFADPLSDPFEGNDDADTLIVESQEQLDLRVGTDNYDVGHTLSTGAGGLAGLGVVCNQFNKARGVTGSRNPKGDLFDVDYVAHELGHQFAADHTWNGRKGSGCGPQQRSATSAYEPGSGSSIMSYAGLCGEDNIADMVDALFHHHSFEQIITYTRNGVGASCGTSEATGNTAPVVNAGSDYIVPKQTPLVIEGFATDSEQQTLLYSWEQRDLGPQAALSDPDDGQVPLFRMLDAADNPIRYLPAFATVLSGIQDQKERLPQVGREMAMRLTVKDSAGGVQSDDIVLTVDADSGPFRVTSPNGGERVGQTKTIRWDTGFTEQAPVNTALVDIYLSTDNGANFDQLIDTVDNLGSANITFPAGIQSQSARLMIKAVGNVFYDVSDAAFEIDSDRLVPPAPIAERVEPGDAQLELIFAEGEPNGVVADTYEAYCFAESASTEINYPVIVGLPFDENTPVSSELEVLDDFTVEDDALRVGLNITHSWRGDVTVDLSSPAGTIVRLKDLSADDGPTPPGEGVIETYPVTALPAEPLSTFSGESTSGTWLLEVADGQDQDSGELLDWRLTVINGGRESEGTASSAASPLIVGGLTNGETYDCRVTPLAEGWPGESVSFPPAIPVGADGNSLTPTFAALTSTADGFTVQVSNYDAEFTWDVATAAGSTSINGTGLITVTGLGAGQSATVTVTASRAGFNDGDSEVIGSANVGAALTPEFGAVSSTDVGFTVQVSNYDSDFTWDVTPTAGTASISSSGLITVTGLTSGQSSVVTAGTSRSGYESGSADISGSANDTGSSLNITFAVTELASTAFEEGDGDTVVLAFTVQADVADAQINGLTLSATGDLNDANEVGAVKLFADANSDGVADTSELVAEGIYTNDNGSVTFAFNEALPITTEASQVLITYQL